MKNLKINFKKGGYWPDSFNKGMGKQKFQKQKDYWPTNNMPFH